MAEKDIKVRIILDDDLTPALKKTGSNIKKETAKASGDVKKLESSFSGLSKAVVGMGAAFAGFAVFSKASQFLSSATDAAKKQMQAEAKLEQVLKATGHAAGLTSEELKNMAVELQNVTTIGDEATIEAQALMLTFRNIGETVFPRAIKATQDMSTLFGGMESATIQLGKALNAPTEGITALRRVGITFSEQQKEQIKQFEKMGEVSKAQNVILEELENQFGGVAEAMANTPIGKLEQANNELGDLAEKLGNDIIPLQTKWVKLQIEVVKGISDIGKAFGLLEQEETIETLTQKIEDNNTAIKFHKAEVEKIGNNWLMGIARKGHEQSIQDFTQENEIIQQQIKDLKILNETKATKDDKGTGGGDGRSALLEKAAEIEQESREKTIAAIEDMANRRIEIEAAAFEVIQENRQTDLERQREYFAEQDAMMNDAFQRDKALRKKDKDDNEKNQSLKLEAAQQFFGGFSELLAVAGKESKEAAIAAKALAITETIITTAQMAANSYKALSGIPYVGPALGFAAAAGATAYGAAQIATISSAKFADGGIVPGNSFTGDRIHAQVNSGEMILNSQQQQNLFSAIKGGGLGGANINISDTVVIEGNADESTVQAIAQTREDQLESLKDMLYELQYSGNLVF